MPSSSRTPAGVAAAAVAFLLPVAFSPAVYTPFWSPKVAVVLVAGAAGLALLAAHAWAHHPAALAGVAFVVAVVLSTAVSTAPWMAALGLYNWGTGAVFWIAVVGMWSLGASTAPEDRGLIGAALLAGIGVSAAVGLVQALSGVGLGYLAVPGRATGLAGNAVQLGGLAAAATMYAAWQRRPHWGWPVVALAAAMTVQLSGTRFALLLLPVAVVAAFIRRGKVAGAVFAIALVVGAAAGGWVAEIGQLESAAGRTADDGLTSVAGGGGGTRVRLEVWTSAAESILERPVLGHGPGRFRAATSRDRTLTVAQLEGGDVLYVDAHNVVVEHLVTTGVLGAAALLAWLLLAARSATGPLLAFAGGLALMALVQPSSVGTTPLLALALGAAGSGGRVPVPAMRKVAVGVAAAIGLAGGAVLLASDHQLEQVRLDLDVDAAERADTLLPPWPEPATMLARAHSFATLDRRSTTDEVIRWRTEALRRDASDPALANLLGREALADGRLRLAQASYERALSWNRYSTAAMLGLAAIAERRGDNEAAVRYLTRVLEVRSDDRVERRLERLREPLPRIERPRAKRPGP